MLNNLITPVPPLGKSIEDWWFNVLKNHGKYSCYGVVLSLPSDTEVTNYLNAFNNELDLISGENCLIIAISKSNIRRSKIDKNPIPLALRNHVDQGHSLQIAKQLKIKIIDFPCLVLFDNIQTPDYLLIPLKDLTVENISKTMREVFSLIQEAILNQEKPLKFLRRNLKIKGLRKKGYLLAINIFNFSGKTLEKIMETWINTLIK